MQVGGKESKRATSALCSVNNIMKEWQARRQLISKKKWGVCISPLQMRHLFRLFEIWMFTVDSSRSFEETTRVGQSGYVFFGKFYLIIISLYSKLLRFHSFHFFSIRYLLCKYLVCICHVSTICCLGHNEFVLHYIQWETYFLSRLRICLVQIKLFFVPTNSWESH